jgi:hypothetical protein
MPRLPRAPAGMEDRVTAVTSCGEFYGQSQKCVVAGLKLLTAKGIVSSSSRLHYRNPTAPLPMLSSLPGPVRIAVRVPPVRRGWLR